ncbi:TetR/AcrR family transcriptional regulator [Deinococcus peraridilitoris]|uniref:Transcriptional regulator n=1 Tax=Deinococcus peraridilitoris (strain DSM 19664 / LMG 22246 / CIP 109416 / KR-200) TaxID=937777 RepID=L0A0E6_DEIPD|nr:TetR/AcrR family transcriptional regulator [Deinococcus peraridilitoris]AFZ66934.1 transcriptional regulator [Deinococcus peraridilitoris DSM 19664]
MTGRSARNKRNQIVTAALQLYRTRSVCDSTLKDVAQAAGIPLGNLYYYFKTRDELIYAVLDGCERELLELLASLPSEPAPAWFAAYFDWLLEDPDEAARNGCPFGTLATELRAMGSPAAVRAVQVVQVYLDAFRERVRTFQVPTEEADEIFLTVQGAYVIARTLNDPALFEQGVRRLRERMEVRLS